MTRPTSVLTVALDEGTLARLADLLAGRLRDAMPDARGTPDWLHTREAAAHLGVSGDAVYRLVQSRSLPHRKVGRRLVFNRRELDAWLDSSHTGRSSA